MENNPTYIILHESCLSNDNKEDRPILQEIAKIKESGKEGIDFIVWEKDPSKIPDGLDKNRPVLVCGAVKSTSRAKLCIDQQLEALRKAGFKAEIYGPGTLTRGENEKFRRKFFDMV